MLRVRTTFTVNKSYWDSFTDLIDRLKLRRDSYLNHVLRQEVKELGVIRPNTENAEAFLKEERGHGDIWELDGVELTKASMSLDKDLLDEINRVCADKHVPRDIFLEECLRFLVQGAANGSCGSPLNAAVELLEIPRAQYVYSNDEKSAYDMLSVSDDEVERRRNEWNEELLVIEAIAQLKGVDMSSITKALNKCTEEKRKQIIDNPEVKKLTKKLREKQETHIDLSDLLS